MITIQTGKESFKHIQGKQLQICECWTCRSFEGENKWCGRKGIEVNYDTVKADCEYFDKKEYCGDCKFFLERFSCIKYPHCTIQTTDHACKKFKPKDKEIYV